MKYFVKIERTTYHVFSIFKMAAVCNVDFQKIKFVVVARVEMTKLHRHTNFIKIGQMVAEISHLTILK